MDLSLQKRIASALLQCSPKRIKIDPSNYSEVKEAITRFDVNNLVNKGLIKIIPKKGISNFHINIKRKQKRKGRQKGAGSRKGKHTARIDLKKTWMNSVRRQRKLLKKLKAKKFLAKKDYKILYLKSKGGFFRSSRHIKTYLEEQKLIKKHG